MRKLPSINGNKTNQSLRAAGATQMYDCGIPEKIIQERTGHRWLDALRMYERTNVEQQQAVSAVLKSTAYKKSTEKMTIAHSISASKQPTNISPSLSFQNLHGCTININGAAPPSHGSTVPTTTATDRNILWN